MVLGSSIAHSDRYGLDCIKAFGHQHGLRCLPRPQTMTGHSVATGAIDVNSDTGFCRAMDPVMSLTSN